MENPNRVPSEAELQFLGQQQKLQQSLVGAIVAGAAAALIGAAIWAAITATTGYQIGFMAIGVGFLVGFAVRFMGKGSDTVFGIVGAVFALLGCALGNLFTIALFIARDQGLGVFEVLSQLDMPYVVDVMSATFDPMDLLFYALAAYFGFRYSIVETAPAAEESAAG